MHNTTFPVEEARKASGFLQAGHNCKLDKSQETSANALYIFTLRVKQSTRIPVKMLL
jgi:hypothetical protein